ncbi:MAG: radical SAM protein [Candidatus Omnitrophica bacterium]|nr:radical SAM protein [Candidatus Omnitrophota bacterium]
MAKETLSEVLAANTKEGILYEKMPDGRIRCFACGHRCPIPEGKAGVCRVRFNEGGKLYVPTGYVGAIQDDPIEKKPFFHAMPGARVLSFGMLGCDFHCGYCFPPETKISTSKGMLSIGEIVSKRMPVEIYTHSGKRRKIKKYFRRNYRGLLFKIKPGFLPPVECTPEHPLLVRLRPDRYPDSRGIYLEAQKLTTDHCLAVPRRYEFSEKIVLSTRNLLQPFTSTYRARHSIPAEMLEQIMQLSRDKKSSRDIGKLLNKSASHIRHLRSKIKSGKWNLEKLGIHEASLVEKDGTIRFSKEHAPGIPGSILLTENLAELLGYYCAEGCVSKSKDRVHSANLSFSFSKKEEDKAERVQKLIKEVFGVTACLVNRSTTLAVSTSKTSLALFFKALCGQRGFAKRVPECIFKAERNIVQSFLSAYVAGDGHITRDRHIRVSTISEELAWGVAWLVTKLGYLPQFYRYAQRTERKLLGRNIKQYPWVYLVRWYETSRKQRGVWEDENFRYVLIQKIEKKDYDGKVYNLEIEEDHTYLANFSTVHNCQNWVTSQALRDPVAVSPPIKTGPRELVKIARERNCEVVASTYNEPLITSEWAVEIFKEAKKAGLVTAYISNGNGTPEVLDFIRPWVDLYKVDLKSFDDAHYRELGGSLENVKQTIRGLYERKFWLEVLTLLIPGFNSSDDEVRRLTEFVAAISPDIPWHVTAFHKEYKMTDPDNTTAGDLRRAAEIGKKSGLRYIYAGNLPGMVGNWENTYCPNCRELLITRFGFQILEDKLSASGGHCPKCENQIPGFWKKENSSRKSDGRIKPVF